MPGLEFLQGHFRNPKLPEGDYLAWSWKVSSSSTPSRGVGTACRRLRRLSLNLLRRRYLKAGALRQSLFYLHRGDTRALWLRSWQANSKRCTRTTGYGENDASCRKHTFLRFFPSVHVSKIACYNAFSFLRGLCHQSDSCYRPVLRSEYHISGYAAKLAWHCMWAASLWWHEQLLSGVFYDSMIHFYVKCTWSGFLDREVPVSFHTSSFSYLVLGWPK